MNIKPKTSCPRDHFFEDGKPVHRHSYCAFIDVLGFRERTLTSYKNGNHNKLLQDFHSALENQVKQLKDGIEETLLYFKSFTDNVVLAHPQFSEDLESEFGAIINVISGYQFDMALKDFFVRGGLSIGGLFIDENSVYGGALFEAYRLESEVAINPIVVFCDDTIKIVNEHLKFYMSIKDSPQNSDILVNQDGRYFINYLRESILENGQLNTDGIELHKTNIEKALTDYTDKPKIFLKYVWLAAYHNYFCDSVSDHPSYDERLKIKADLTAYKFAKLSEVQKT